MNIKIKPHILAILLHPRHEAMYIILCLYAFEGTEFTPNKLGANMLKKITSI